MALDAKNNRPNYSKKSVISISSDGNVAFHVQGQVIGPREGPFAQTALERPVARVFAVVASQFVAAREFPAAALPRTLVRLLTC